MSSDEPKTTEQRLRQMSDEAYDALMAAVDWGEGYQSAYLRLESLMKDAYELGRLSQMDDESG
jgi:hypothetical protein